MLTPASSYLCHYFFFFNDTATTEIYTLSLHDALPICRSLGRPVGTAPNVRPWSSVSTDRKSTRLNSSHGYISYAVFCLKKQKKKHCVKTTRKLAPRILQLPSDVARA